MYKIFIVEDDKKIRSELSALLEKYGFCCFAADDFQNVYKDIEKTAPHLVLLDINLPYYDGYSILREIRKKSNIPVIMVTSRDTEADELISMNIGADDFITKPYNTGILIARINALLQRAYGFKNQIMEYNGLSLDIAKSEIIYEQKTAELTKNEMKLLSVLMENKGNIVSRDELIDELWQTDSFIDDNTLSVNMNRLRKKIEDIGKTGYIKTKRGIGYSL